LAEIVSRHLAPGHFAFPALFAGAAEEKTAARRSPETASDDSILVQ
jgi:hypothetical protein